MKGYIYTMFAGADPSHGWELNDPIFGKTPTLGACVPNIRRNVQIGDYIFAVSGRVKGAKQFVVGGFRVAEKIDALSAYHRFPDLRMVATKQGVRGNIIVAADGTQVPVDTHGNFAARVANYLVGNKPIVLKHESEYERGREQTVPTLSRIFQRKGDRVFDIIGRQRRLEASQVEELLGWMHELKGRNG
jgi:hypothetical protein